MILEKGVVFWLLRDFNGQKVEYSEDVAKELKQLWDAVFLAYLDEVDDYNTKKTIRQMGRIVKNQLKYQILRSALQMYTYPITNEARRKLETFFHEKGYKVSHKKNVKKQLDVIVNDLKDLEMNIKQEQLDFQAKQKTVSNGEVKQNIYKDCAQVQKALDMKKPPNPMTTTCPQWLGYMKLIKDVKEAA